MKITAFNPIILTKNSGPLLELFEALGFEKKHIKDGIENGDVTSYDMKNSDGFRINIAQADKLPQDTDLTVIRMNVSDFNEAYEFLTARGFKNVQGDKVADTGSSKVALMVSPSGYAISLAQHIKM